MSSYAKNRRICEPSDPLSPEEIISLAISITMVVTILILTIISIPSLQKLLKLNKRLKCSFITTIISFFCGQLSATVISTICHTFSGRMAMIPMTFVILSYNVMILTLVGSLITRLYITFDKSVYKIANITRYIVNTMHVITILLFMTAVAVYVSAIFREHPIQGQVQISLTIYFAAAGFSFYLITAAFAGFLFARKMMKLVHLRATSRSAQCNGENGARISELNTKQKCFIDKISRYVSLFTCALISTLATMLSPFVAEAIPSLFTGRFIHLILISRTIDSALNVVCLTLQYSFTTSFYYKYCIWI